MERGRVNNLWRVRIARAAKQFEITPQQLIRVWRDPSPHFRGDMFQPDATKDGLPHRYDSGDTCVYCARPKDFPGKDFSDDSKEPS